MKPRVFSSCRKKYKPLNLGTDLQVVVGQESRNVSSFFPCMNESWSSEQKLTPIPPSIFRSLFEPSFLMLQAIVSPEKDKHITLYTALLYYNIV